MLRLSCRGDVSRIEEFRRAASSSGRCLSSRGATVLSHGAFILNLRRAAASVVYSVMFVPSRDATLLLKSAPISIGHAALKIAHSG